MRFFRRTKLFEAVVCSNFQDCVIARASVEEDDADVLQGSGSLGNVAKLLCLEAVLMLSRERICHESDFKLLRLCRVFGRSEATRLIGFFIRLKAFRTQKALKGFSLTRSYLCLTDELVKPLEQADTIRKIELLFRTAVNKKLNKFKYY